MDNQQQKNRDFGRDFLTYLCYRSDKNAGTFQLSGSGQQCSVWIDGKIALEDDRDLPPDTVTYSGENFTGQDFKRAIRGGKRVREARFRIERGRNTWLFVLRADGFHLTGLKSDMPRTDDAEERFFDRMLGIEALHEILDELYGQFLTEVYGTSWKAAGFPEFQKWLHADG